MSDGIEERQEVQRRIEKEKQEDRDDRVYRDNPDPWEPERTDS